MASTKIPSYKQKELCAILVQPFVDKETEKRNVLRKYITDCYKEMIPDKVKEMFEKFPDFIETQSYVHLCYVNDGGYNDYDAVYFLNDEDKSLSLSLPVIDKHFTEALKAKGKYDKAYELLMDYYNENLVIRNMTKKINNAIEVNNTPTKLKDNMPTAYKVYMEKIEHITKEVDNGCDAAELVNAHLSKFFNN